MHVTILLLLASATIPAAENETRSNDHQALRDLLAATTAALNQRDLEALDGLLLKPYTFVTSDQTPVTDLESLRQADAKWFSGPDAPIASLTFTPVVDAPATFLSDTIAVAGGTCTDTITLRSGEDVRLTSRWTATVVKTADGWKVASAHAGINPFDNPVIDRLGKSILNVAIGTGIAGLLAGLLLGLLLGRRRARA